jgi:hypothetical protein
MSLAGVALFEEIVNVLSRSFAMAKSFMEL